MIAFILRQSLATHCPDVAWSWTLAHRPSLQNDKIQGNYGTKYVRLLCVRPEENWFCYWWCILSSKTERHGVFEEDWCRFICWCRHFDQSENPSDFNHKKSQIDQSIWHLIEQGYVCISPLNVIQCCFVVCLCFILNSLNVLNCIIYCASACKFCKHGTTGHIIRMLMICCIYGIISLVNSL